MVTLKATANDPPEEVLRAAVQATALRNLFVATRGAHWAQLVPLIAIVLVAHGRVPNTTLVVWSAVVMAALVVRFLYLGYMLRRPEFPEPVASVLLSFCVSAAAFATVFAAGFLILVPSLDDYRRALLLVIFAGMCAGASVTMSGQARAYYSFTLPLLLPPAAYSAWLSVVSGGTAASVAETFILVSYLGLMVFVHTRASAASRKSLTLQMEKSALADALKSANANLERDRDNFRQSALTDGLTGIPNRRQFDEVVADEWRRGARGSSPLGCLLLDIDHFKLFNDRYGHDAGDECLVRVAQAIAEVARRGGDHAARYGGEEFVVILPATDIDGVAFVGEKIRQRVESLGIEHADSALAVITVSVGAASVRPDMGSSPGVLVKRADKALYRAKEEGRNRVVLDELVEDPTITALVEPGLVSESSSVLSR